MERRRNFAAPVVFKSLRVHSVDVETLRESRTGLLGGRSPLLRFQSDERLIALIRAGNEAAFEQLFERYRSRLMAFCRHMLRSSEDAEDVMQDVFVNAYRAIRADEREIDAKPWLYRIARNRCLNHLRRPAPDGRDTMDEFVGAGGSSTADVVHKRAELRHLLEDVNKLPETQRTALLMREIDALSYDQISEAMETTVSSVKSLLVRARMSLAEANEARALTCDDVRLQFAEVAEGIKKATPALKRHARECDDCRAYRKSLRKTNTAMALAFPVGPLMVLKKLVVAKLGLAALGGSHAGSGAGAAAGTTMAAGGVAATGAGSAASVGAGALITKAAVGVALTALVAGGAVEANKAVHKRDKQHAAPAAAPAANSTGGVSAEGAEEAERKKAAEEESAATGTTEDGADTSESADGEATQPAGSEVQPTPSTGSDQEAGGGGGDSTPVPDVAPNTGGSSPPSGGDVPVP